MNFIYNNTIRLGLNVPFGVRQAPRNQQIKNAEDNFTTNPIYDRVSSKLEIEATISRNSKIKSILNQYNLQAQVNVEELEKLKEGHLKQTRIVAAKIYSSLPENLKNSVNITHLQEAAMLHDYGKVLIPNNILNKNGKLNDKEREIIEQHSELGYELLKDKGFSEETLNLVKYHHQNSKRSGYPTVDSKYQHSLSEEILNVADKYVALREKRSYKNPLGKYEALEIIAKDVNNGLISQEVYTALIKSTV